MPPARAHWRWARVAEAPGDRRADIGEAEVQPGGIDLRFVALDRGPELRHQSLLLIEALPGLETGSNEPAIAVQITFCGLKLRLVLGLGRPCQFQRRLVGARIDLEQQVAFTCCPSVKADDRAIYPRLYCDGVERLNGADALQVLRDISGNDNAWRDGHRWRFLRLRFWRFLGEAKPPYPERHKQ